LSFGYGFFFFRGYVALTDVYHFILVARLILILILILILGPCLVTDRLKDDGAALSSSIANIQNS